MCETNGEQKPYLCRMVKAMLKAAKEWRAEQKKKGTYQRKSWGKHYESHL